MGSVMVTGKKYNSFESVGLGVGGVKIASIGAIEAKFQDLRMELGETPLEGPSSYISGAGKSTEESIQATEEEVEALLREYDQVLSEEASRNRDKAELEAILHELIQWQKKFYSQWPTQ